MQFSSKAFRKYAVGELKLARAGQVAVAPERTEAVVIDWSNRNCFKGSAHGVAVAAVCPHSTRWPYTTVDCKMGLACQGKGTDSTSTAVRTYMRNFLKQANWVRHTWISSSDLMIFSAEVFLSASFML